MNAKKLMSSVAAAALLVGSLAYAQEKKPAVPSKPAAVSKPAAAPKAPSAPSANKGGTPGASTAPHGLTTGGATTAHGATTAGGGVTTASHGPTTATGHTGTPTAGGRAGSSLAGGRSGSSPMGGHSGTPVSNHGGGMAGGRTPAGNHIARTPNGSTMRTRPGGQRAEFHDAKRGMDVHHGLDGRRRVGVERADHSRVYAERGGRGYVQRPYMYHGREYGHRTYYYNGRAYDRFYNRYSYHGVYVYGYAPAYYYAPAFYGWAYNPWYAPVPYTWGYVGTPWFGFYGGWFQPAPVYPSASLWLADYMLSQSLQANYAAQQAAAAEAGGPPPQQAMAPDAAPLTPEVKQAIADEVRRQIALENQEATQTAAKQDIDPASSGIARELSDNQPHVFVAGAGLDVIDSDGMECAVSEGDALQLVGPPPPDATAADLLMLSSKGGKECRKGAKVSVAIADLQEMQNHMRETIDAGLSDLQKKGGQEGLPPVPPSAAAPPVKAEFASIAPPPDANAAQEINQQVSEADKAEQEIGAQAPGDASGPSAAAPEAPAAPPPAELAMGQTYDQVKAILGVPKSIADVGPKKIYVYKDVKVTFLNGKVTDIQ